MPLTDIQIRNAKPKKKEQKLFDGGVLFLRITPKGGKHWKYSYRHPVDKSQQTLSIGSYPEITLAKAREKHAEARRLGTSIK